MNVVLFACVIQVFFKLSVARLALGADGDLDYTCRDEFCRAKGGEALLQVKQSLMFEKSLPKRSYDGLEELEDWMDKRSQHQLSWEEFTRPDKSYSEDRSHHVTPSVKKKKKKVQEFEAAKKIFSGIEPYEKAPAAHAPQAASAPPSTPPVAVSGRPAAPAPAAASVPPSTHHLLPRRATPGLRRAKNPPSTPPAVMSAPPAAPPAAPAPVEAQRNNFKEDAFYDQAQKFRTNPAARHMLSEKQIGLGDTAALTEDGFNSVRELCCTAQMTSFIRRMIETAGDGRGVCNEGGLTGLAIWYDCKDEDPTFDFAKLQVDLAVDSPSTAGECP